MISRHKSGPPIDGAIGRARDVEHAGERLKHLNSADHRAGQARRLVDDLEANGAELHFRAGTGNLLPTFTYELRSGGDRQRCRLLIAEAKASDPMLWAAVLREIAMRSKEAQ